MGANYMDTVNNRL